MARSKRMAKVRRRGRPSIFDEGLKESDLVAAYNKAGSCRKAAILLGISDRALRKYLRALGFQIDTRRPVSGPTLDSARGHQVAGLVAWVKENPRIKLPRSYAGIAAKTGLNEKSIRSFLLRRARRLKVWLKSLGNLTSRPAVVTDTTGLRIPTDAIEKYELAVDIFDLAVKLKIWIKYGGYREARLTWKEYIELFGLTEADAPWARKKLSKTVDNTPEGV